MKLICNDEVRHVEIGVKWFEMLCKKQNLEPITTFHNIVKQYVGIIPPPFNSLARSEAGMSPEYYEPLAFKKLSSKQ